LPTSLTSVSYGIFTTTTPLTSYAVTATYQITSIINCSQYLITNPIPVPLTLSPSIQSPYFNDNQVGTTSTTNFGSTDNYGITMQSAYSKFTYYNNFYVACQDGSCGLDGLLNMQLYTLGGSTILCPPAQFSSPVSSSTGGSTAGPSILSGSLCLLSYSLPVNVDYPWSVATSLSFYYNTSVTFTTHVAAVQLLNGTGTRTYTNRFGATFSTLSPSQAQLVPICSTLGVLCL